MKKFLIRFTVFLTVGYALLFLVQYLIDENLKESKTGDYQKWNEVSSGIVNAEVIAIGSSRTLNHYDPEIFSKELNLSFHNIGESGANFDLQKFIRNIYFEANMSPKIIIQNVDITSFFKTTEYFKAPFLPYYSFKNYKDLNEINSNSFPDVVIPMYKYRFYLLHHQKLFKSISRIYDRGYIEVDKDWVDREIPFKLKNNSEFVDYGKIDIEKGLKNLKYLANFSKKTDAEVYLIWAPAHDSRLKVERPYYEKISKKIKNLANEFDNVNFLDFSNDIINHDKKYFFNDYHLNKQGVAIYNRKVVDSIRKLSKQRFD